MIHFRLIKMPSGYYRVTENGIQIYNDIFNNETDFRGELKALGFDKPFTISVINEQKVEE